MLRKLKNVAARWCGRWQTPSFKPTLFIYPVTVTSLANEKEIGHEAHNRLSDQELKRGVDYESSWWAVSGERDYYKFVFKLEIHQRLFRQRWFNNVRG